MHAFAFRLLATVFGLLLLSQQASATRAGWFALVIGNSRYIVEGPNSLLPNAVTDATRIGKTLQSLGFDVTLKVDLATAEFQSALDEFYSKHHGADATVVIYYSGHALQVNGVNYAIPVDYVTDASSRADLGVGLVNLNNFIDRLALAAKIRIVLLDACRINPFVDGRSDRSKIRLHARAGLAQIDKGKNLLVSYATLPDKTASDGERGSPYAIALERTLPRRGLEIQQVLSIVAKLVGEATDQKQSPWAAGTLDEPFYFRKRAYLVP